MFQSIVHRALVTYSNSANGEIRVKIPAVTGQSEVYISYIGRAKQHGAWVVPAVGEQIIVSADDEHMTNIFWLRSDAYIAHALTPDYGSFYDDQIQTNPVANVQREMKFRNTFEAHNVSIVSDSQITVAYAGVYNIQFSAQLDKTDSGEDHVDIWLRYNGADVAWSNTRMTMPKNDAKLVAAWNFVLTMDAGSYAQIMWLSDDASMRLYAEAAGTSPVHPAIPSVILTVTRAV